MSKITWNKQFDLNKKLLLITTTILSILVIAIFTLSIVVFKHHKSERVFGIQIISGPTLMISLLSLIPSSICMFTLIWLNYLLWKKGIKNILIGKVKIHIITCLLYIIVVLLIIVTTSALIIALMDWNQQLVII